MLFRGGLPCTPLLSPLFIIGLFVGGLFIWEFVAEEGQVEVVMLPIVEMDIRPFVALLLGVFEFVPEFELGTGI